MSQLTVQQAFDLAIEHFRAGRFRESDELCRQVLSADPKHPGALHQLGVIALLSGQNQIALDLFQRSLAAAPDVPEVQGNLGNALMGLKRLDESILAFRRAIALRPNFAEAYSNLGNALNENGSYDQAIIACRQAISLRPGYPGALYNLGTAFKSKGQFDEAITAYREAIANKPDYAQAYINLGNALKHKSRPDEAIAAYRQAIALNPNEPIVHNNLGNILWESKWDLAAARSCFDRALALRPDYAEALTNLGNTDLEAGNLDGAIAAYRRVIALKPDANPTYSNLFLSLHYHPGQDPAGIAHEHRQWNLRCAQPLSAQFASHSNDRNLLRRLRIGYVSPDFREHPVARFLLPLLSNHDHTQVEVFAYTLFPVSDAMTQKLKAHIDTWRSLIGLSDARAADQIREDKIDILIDLVGHTADNRLLMFARKPAPVQVTYLGYPDSTGLSAMDYRLTDAFADPPGLTERYHSEQLVRLFPCAWCFSTQMSPPISPRNNSTITFGSFNTFAKINQPTLQLWTRILNAVPGSKLLIKAAALDSVVLRRELETRLLELGISVDRVDLRGHTATYADHMALYDQVDIALDTFPYHGTTTTCEAMWMGVPVISLAGAIHASRVGVSLLSNLGLQKLLARTPDEYARLAIELANDRPRLAELRATLRQRMQQSALMDEPAFARKIEDAYRWMWSKWCKPQSAEDAVKELFAVANEHFQGNRWPEAERCCRQILFEQPANADALHFLGVILFRKGQKKLALDSIQQSLSITPNSPEALNNLGNILTDLGRFDEAIAVCRKSIALKPGYPGALNHLGLALKSVGKTDEAIDAFQEAIANKPDYAQAFIHLGDAWKQKRKPDEAIAAYRQAFALDPNDPVSHNLLGNFLWESKRDLDQAIGYLNRALELQPDYDQAMTNLGNVLMDVGRLDEAIAMFRRVIAIKPDLSLNYCNLFFAMLYHPQADAAAIAQEQQKWNLAYAEPLRQFIKPHTNDRNPHKRLRIGYVSANFREHAVARFLLPLLTNHDHQQVEIFAYSVLPIADSTTQQLRACTDAWRDLFGVSDEKAADQIRNDQIDILVDLIGHSADNRLLIFARKPAPVQVTYLGYPNSTGLQTIDYRFTDAHTDPPGLTEQYYTEQLVRLPQTAWCFDPQLRPEIVPRHEPSITFGSFNTFSKINQPLLELWSQILHAVPLSRLLLKASALESAALQKDVLRRLDALGISPDRVELRGQEITYAAHLSLYAQMDIALDTFPYHGTTTTCEAMWMGVPVISLAGATHVSRVGVSLLASVDLSDLAARNPEEYIRIAVRLANDRPRLADLRATLRSRIEQSPLMDSFTFARNIETIYRQMWIKWCDTAPTQSTIPDTFAKAQQHHIANRLPEAEKLYREILAEQPRHAESLHFLGVVAIQKGQKSVAEDLIRQSLAIAPESPLAHGNLGNVLTTVGRWDEAIVACRRAIALKPDYLDAYCNLGNALAGKGQLDEAVIAYRQTIALKPDYAEAYSNLGNVFKDQQKLDDAIAQYRRAISIKPSLEHVHLNLSHMLLAQGNLTEGWDEYEWRLKCNDHVSALAGNISQPQWAGEPLNGRTLLIHAEQGFGDTIQMIRYLPLIAQDGGKIVVACYPETKRLFQTIATGCQLIGRGEPLPALDLHCPILSLPHVFKTTLANIPNHVPYLSADLNDVKTWQERLSVCSSGLKVGLAWSGNAAHTNNRNRSMAQSVLAPLASVPGVTFVSLQRNESVAKVKPESSISQLVDYTDQLHDFADSAALIANLDLVIAVDTAVAHLAGALGKPVWVMLPFAADWRWLTHREDSLWYPSMRLFRQSSRADWEGVITKVADALRTRVGANTPAINVKSASTTPQTVSHQDIPKLFGVAQQQHQAGRAHEAELLYRQILAAQPRHAPSLHMLGVLAFQIGQHDAAVQLINQSLEISPDAPEALGNLANALAATGNLDGAIATYRKAVAMRPTLAEAYSNLGSFLKEKGEFDESEAVCRRAIALKPEYPSAHCNLANALKAKGQLVEAIASYRRAIALLPTYAEAYNNLGNTYTEQLDFEEAIAAYRQAIAIRPAYTEALSNLGSALTFNGQYNQAIASCLAAIAVNPCFVDAQCNLANCLGIKGKIDESLAAFRKVLELKPDYRLAHGNLLLNMHYHPTIDAAAIAEEHRRWNEKHGLPGRKHIRSHNNDRDPQRRLRIGYVSPDFREHAVAHFFTPLVMNHDHQQFEVFGYSQVLAPDAMTQKIKDRVDVWRNTVGMSDDLMTDLIRDDKIDILIDLAGHTSGNRLVVFTRKPAPLQVSFLGYPDTTGLTAIDYRLTDAYADPPGMTDAYHSETLFRLSRCAWCFGPSAPVPVLRREPGPITFGSFNTFSKITLPMLKIWTRILHAVPDSRLLLKAGVLRSAEFQQELRQQFAELGIAPERILLYGQMLSYTEHLTLYEKIDIALDTYPYNGTTNTCEALWMGVPVVSLSGTTHVSRVGVSLLNAVGLTELLTDDPEEYIRIAIDLANDRSRLAKLHATLRQQVEQSTLMNGPAYAKDVEQAYRKMWHAWCGTSS